MHEHFVEIEVRTNAASVVYRFFGRGVWKVKLCGRWRPVNAIYVPGAALRVAAAQCQ